MLAEARLSLDGFEQFSAGLPGALTVAVLSGPAMEPLVLGEDRPFHAWSTIKVPVLAALLSFVHLPALAPEQRELARLAITRSDNAAILELFVLLEGLAGGPSEAAGAIERLFQQSGEARTRVTLDPPPPGAITPFGQTGWRVADCVRFFGALAAGRLLPAAATQYVLGLLQTVIPEQRWGLGRLTRVACKGGWGPEPGGTCLVRQTGVLLGSGTVIGLVAQPPPGDESFETGVEMLNQAAGWLAGRLAGTR